MNAIAQITASRDICQTLVKLGIEPKAFFWHLKELTPNKDPEKSDIITWDVWELNKPVYEENECIPAWTKQELDLLIGGDVMKPDLLPMNNVKVGTKKVGDDNKTVYIYQYAWFDQKGMSTWERTFQVINPGPTASAQTLLTALQKGWVTPEMANDRYSQFLKP